MDAEKSNTVTGNLWRALLQVPDTNKPGVMGPDWQGTGYKGEPGADTLHLTPRDTHTSNDYKQSHGRRMNKWSID